MIVNHTHRFIFIHIPKCAGTSVTNFLAMFTRYCDIEVGGTEYGEFIQPHYYGRFGLRKHSTAREIRRVVGEGAWADYFKFAIARNPFERAISTYNFLTRWTDWTGSGIMSAFPDVNHFILSDFWMSTDGPDWILAPQTEFLNAGPVDYLGRAEDVTKALVEIAARQALPIDAHDIMAPLVGESPVPSRLFQLSERALERIRNRYARDFETFGYSLDRGGGADPIRMAAPQREARSQPLCLDAADEEETESVGGSSA